MGETSLDALLRPTIALVTKVDLVGHDRGRVAAGDVRARATRHQDWVRVWSHDRRPQDGITTSVEALATALDQHWVAAHGDSQPYWHSLSYPEFLDLAIDATDAGQPALEGSTDYLALGRLVTSFFATDMAKAKADAEASGVRL